MKKLLKPVQIKEGDHIDDGVYSHPAFGRVILAKSTRGGSGTNLFCSELKHHSTLHIQVEQCNASYKYGQFRPNGGKVIVDIEMSEAQWAQFISSPGWGDGTPCTLRYKPENPAPLMNVPEIELEGLVKRFDAEIKKKTAQYVDEFMPLVEQLHALANAPGSISKTDLKKLAHDLRIRTGNLPSNMGFMQETLKEAMDKTISDGKIEMEAFVSNMVTALGLEQLREMAPQLAAPTLPVKYITIDKVGERYNVIVPDDDFFTKTGIAEREHALLAAHEAYGTLIDDPDTEWRIKDNTETQ